MSWKGPLNLAKKKLTANIDSDMLLEFPLIWIQYGPYHKEQAAHKSRTGIPEVFNLNRFVLVSRTSKNDGHKLLRLL